MYTWVCITSTGSDLPGIQRMVQHLDHKQLMREVATSLEAFGATVTEAASYDAREARVNQTLPIVQVQFGGPRETGLEVSLYPCSADGTNLDVTPNEPRAE